MDLPLADGTSVREQYTHAASLGIPTPLTDAPEVPNYLQDIMALFWDIVQFKASLTSRILLSEIESYIRLFEVQIEPFKLKLICNLDREYTSAINLTIQERQVQS